MALLLSACGAEVPPLGELPLRDALRASPEAVAMLPDDERLGLAARFEVAHQRPAETERVPVVGPTTAGGEVRRVDGVRETRGEDALVLARLTHLDEEVRADGLSVEVAAAGPSEPVELTGSQPAWTGPLEAAALSGRAGALVEHLADRFEAQQLVRVTSWPAAIVVRQDTIYVNASWLVALSPVPSSVRQPPTVPTTSSADSPRSSPAGGPGSRPQGLDYSPYRLPDTLLGCANSLENTCVCAASGSCEGEPISSSFGSMQQECAWVLEDAVRARALCALALSSIDWVRDCLESGAACTVTPDNLEHALAFAENEDCLHEIDNCLRYGEPEADEGSSSSCECGDDDSRDVCDDCAQSCWNESCNCESLKCKDKKASGGIGDEERSCRVAARPARLVPHGYLAWLLAPLVYLLFYARRRR